MPVLIVSDNAKTFQATEKALKKLFDFPEVKADLERDRIEWKRTRSRKRGYFRTASGGTSKNLELKGKFLEYLRQLS